MAKRKSLEDIKREEEKLKEQIAKKRQKLQALKRKLQSQYRKREARFLIAIGRTLLKHGEKAKVGSEEVILLPLKNSAFLEAFSEYIDVVKLNNDFRKWLPHLSDKITEAVQSTAEKEGKDSEQG